MKVRNIAKVLVGAFAFACANAVAAPSGCPCDVYWQDALNNTDCTYGVTLEKGRIFWRPDPDGGIPGMEVAWVTGENEDLCYWARTEIRALTQNQCNIYITPYEHCLRDYIPAEWEEIDNVEGAQCRKSLLRLFEDLQELPECGG